MHKMSKIVIFSIKIGIKKQLNKIKIRNKPMIWRKAMNYLMIKKVIIFQMKIHRNSKVYKTEWHQK